MTAAPRGQGLAHATAPRPLSYRAEELISARWLDRWLVPLMSAARNLGDPDPVGSVQSLRAAHQAACARLVVAGIPWRSIRKQDLDDPRLTLRELMRRMRDALARREPRLGRQNGIRRTRSTRTPQGGSDAHK